MYVSILLDYSIYIRKFRCKGTLFIEYHKIFFACKLAFNFC